MLIVLMGTRPTTSFQTAFPVRPSVRPSSPRRDFLSLCVNSLFSNKITKQEEIIIACMSDSYAVRVRLTHFFFLFLLKIIISAMCPCSANLFLI